MTEHVDVLVVGAGLSGIGAAHHLHTERPGTRYLILEGRDAIGGTWDLFRYPGIRSDSDMQTLGYRFRPWTAAESIADGPAILDYVRDTARAAGIDRHIRFGHRVVAAEWSSADARWTVRAEHDGAPVEFTCSFLYLCGGYYRYDRGHTPDFPGIEDYTGRVVHPQDWPADLDHAGRKVVVIGSGATAVTLVPALARTAERVTMLQRSPTWIARVPARDPFDARVRRLLGTRRAYPVTRWKNILVGLATYGLSKRFPGVMGGLLRRDAAAQLPAGFDVGTHFSPSYGPWDQRLCAAPEGDIFRALSDGSAEVVTDRIDRFTATGIRLRSGRHLDADVVVTATGLALQFLGGIALRVDGREVSVPDTLVYKASMLSGVPNMAFTFGYTNSSWTLRADLVAEYVCRLLRHMERHGFRSAVPVPDDPGMERTRLVSLSSGYIDRALHLLPGSGRRSPWRLGSNYLTDVVLLRHRRIDDGLLRFDRPAPVARPTGSGDGADAGAGTGSGVRSA